MRSILVTLLSLGLVSAVIYLTVAGTASVSGPEDVENQTVSASLKWPTDPGKTWKTLTPNWETARFDGGAFDKKGGAAWGDSPKEVVNFSDLYRSSDAAYDAFSKAARKGNKDVLKQLPGEGDCSWCPGFYDQVEKGLRKSGDSSSWDFRLLSSRALANMGDPGRVDTLIDLSKDLPPGEGAAAARAIKELETTTPEIVDRLAENLTNETAEEQPQMLTDAMVSALTRDGSVAAAQALYEHALNIDDPDYYTDVGIGLGAMKPLPETMPYLTEIAQKGDQYSYLAINSMLRFGDDGVKAVFDVLENSEAGAEPTALKGVFASLTIESDATKKFVYSQRKSDNPAVSAFAKEIVKELEIDIPKKDREIVYTDTYEQGIVWDQSSGIYDGQSGTPTG